MNGARVNGQTMRAHFNNYAADYDAQRARRLHYLEMQRVILRAIPYPAEEAFSVLELGIGTGLLSEQLLKRFRRANLEGYDLSDGMLAHASDRLQPFGARVRLFQANLAQNLPEKTYDVVCSSMALRLIIHQLSRPERFRFYRALTARLTPRGVLLISDSVRPPTEALAKRYAEMRERERCERDGAEQLADERRRAPDETERLVEVDEGATTLEEALTYLRQAGLVNVDCIWKQRAAVVLYAEQVEAGG